LRLHMRAFTKGKMQRDRRLRLRHGHRYLVVAYQEPDLFDQIVAEKLRPGDRRGVEAGRGDVARGTAGVAMAEAGRLEADLRIKGAVAAGDGSALGERREGIDQEAGIALVERHQRLDGGLGIVKQLRFEWLRADEIDRGKGRDSLVHTPL